MNDFQVGPLTLRVKSYANDVSADFYNSNWLNIAVKCPTDAGDVGFQAACLMTTDIVDFLDELQDLLGGKGRQAFLVSLEPQVDVCLSRGEGPDAFQLDVELTPNADDDEDLYEASATVSRTDLETVAAQAAQIAQTFPMRGDPDK